MDVKIDLQSGKLVHEQKLKDRKQSIASDAASIAWFIVRKKLESERNSESYNSEPEDVIRSWSEEGQVQWTYALIEDQKYVHEVERRTSKLVEKILDDIKHNKGKLVALYPTPGAPGGGGSPPGGEGGGLEGLFGGIKKRVVRSSSDGLSPQVDFFNKITINYLPGTHGGIFNTSLEDDALKVASRSTEVSKAIEEFRRSYPEAARRALSGIKESIRLFNKQGKVDEFIEACATYFDDPDGIAGVPLHMIVSAQMEGIIWAEWADLSLDFSKGSNSTTTRVSDVLKKLGSIIEPRIYNICVMIEELFNDDEESPRDVAKIHPIMIKGCNNPLYRKEKVDVFLDPGYTTHLESWDISYCRNMSKLLANLTNPKFASRRGEIINRLGRLVALDPEGYKKLGAEDALLACRKVCTEDVIALQLDPFEALVRLIDSDDDEYVKLFDSGSMPTSWKAHVATLAISKDKKGFIDAKPNAWFNYNPWPNNAYISREFFLNSGKKAHPDSVRSATMTLWPSLQLSGFVGNTDALRDAVAFETVLASKDTKLVETILSMAKSTMKNSFAPWPNALSAAISVALDLPEDADGIAGVEEELDGVARTLNGGKGFDENTWSVVMEKADKIRAKSDTCMLYECIMDRLSKKSEDYSVAFCRQAALLVGDKNRQGESSFSRTFGITPEGYSQEEAEKLLDEVVSKQVNADSVIAAARMAMQFGGPVGQKVADAFIGMSRNIPPIDKMNEMFSLVVKCVGQDKANDLAGQIGYEVSGDGRLSKPDWVGQIMQGTLPDDKAEGLAQSNPSLMASYISMLWRTKPSEAKRILSLLSTSAKELIRPLVPWMPDALFKRQPVKKLIDVEAGKKVIIVVGSREDQFICKKKGYENSYSGNTVKHWIKNPLPNENGIMRQFVLSSDVDMSPDRSKRIIELIKSAQYLPMLKSLKTEMNEDLANDLSSAASGFINRSSSNDIAELLCCVVHGAFRAARTSKTRAYSEDEKKALKAFGTHFYPIIRSIRDEVNSYFREQGQKDAIEEHNVPPSLFHNAGSLVKGLVQSAAGSDEPLSHGQIETAVDIKALCATLRSYEQDAAEKAALRLARLIAILPDEPARLGVQDSNLMLNPGLWNLVMASRANDDEFMKFWEKMPVYLMPHMATLAVTQGRPIIKSLPWFYEEPQTGHQYVSRELFLKSNLSTPESMAGIKAIFRNPGMMEDGFHSDLWSLPFGYEYEYVKYALEKTVNQSLAREMLTNESTSPEAFAWLCENGDSDDFRLLADFVERSKDKDTGEPKPLDPSKKYMWAAILANADRIKGTPLHEAILARGDTEQWNCHSEVANGFGMLSYNKQVHSRAQLKIDYYGRNRKVIFESVNKNIEKGDADGIRFDILCLPEMHGEKEVLRVLEMVLKSWPEKNSSSYSRVVEKITNGLSRESIGEARAILLMHGFSLDDRNGLTKSKTPQDYIKEGRMPDEMALKLAENNPLLLATYISRLNKNDREEAWRLVDLIPQDIRPNVMRFVAGWVDKPSKKLDTEASRVRTVKVAADPPVVSGDVYEMEWAREMASKAGLSIINTPEREYLFSILEGHPFPHEDGVSKTIYHKDGLNGDEILNILKKTGDERIKKIYDSMKSAAEKVSLRLLKDKGASDDFVSMCLKRPSMLPWFLEGKINGPMGMLLARAFGASDPVKSVIGEMAGLASEAISEIKDVAKENGLEVMHGMDWPSPGGIKMNNVPDAVEWRTWSDAPHALSRYTYHASRHLPSIRNAMANLNPRTAEYDMRELLRGASATLAFFPDYYERFGLTEEEIGVYRSNYPKIRDELEFLLKLKRAIRSDDAYLMELWADEKLPYRRKCIADLAAVQKRMAVIMGNPTMWNCPAADVGYGSYGDQVSQAFFELTDMKNPKNIEAVVKLSGNHKEDWLGGLEFSKVLYSALIRSGSVDIAKSLTNEKGRSRFQAINNSLEGLAACLAIDSQSEDDELHGECIERLSGKDLLENRGQVVTDVLVFMPPTKNAEHILNQVSSSRKKLWSGDVSNSFMKAGRQQFSRFCKVTGFSSLGHPLEDIFNKGFVSAWDVAMLMEDLVSIGNHSGVLRMLDKEASKSLSEPSCTSRPRPDVVKTMMDACERLGVTGKAIAIMSKKRLAFHDGQLIDLSKSDSPPGYVDRMPTEDVLSLVLLKFRNDKESASRLLRDYPLERRPDILRFLPLEVRRAPEMPYWVRGFSEQKPTDVEAKTDRDGKVIRS